VLNSIMEAVTVTAIINPVSAANTAAATSAGIATAGYEGDIALVLQVGVITGTLDFTFATADNSGMTNPTAVTPVGGALAQVTTSNDVATYVAVIPSTQSKGWIQVIGTIVTGPALIGYSMVGMKKYGT
jgi:hypothetical protein